jgi:SAM-dependent methyltransferase
MLLTLTSTRRPATDLGYLLHKNPARPQAFDLSFGQAHVFYPEASDERCTAALLLDVDPVGLVRGRQGGPSGDRFSLDQYVNDRPYVASSFLSVAIAQVFGSALGGRCKDKPDLVATPMPLSAALASVPCRGGEAFLRRLFEPLGYAVSAERLPLDEQFPEWGEGQYWRVTLDHPTVTVSDLLGHLYVLVPVLDNDKHYWVGEEEVQKLLRHGEGWLAAHPEREQIVGRYLKHRKDLARQALAQLLEEDQKDEEAVAERHADEEETVERSAFPGRRGSERAGDGRADAEAPATAPVAPDAPGEPDGPANSFSSATGVMPAPIVAPDRPPTLNQQRLDAVVRELLATGAESVLDLGCSTGNLLRRLLAERPFARIVGLDVSYRALEVAADRLRLDRLPERQRQRIQLLQGSLGYRDARLAGFDAAAVVEVIEHLDPFRLAAFERVLFEFAKPKTVVVTTPNVEYNVRFPTLEAGRFRHRDHRFEWTREQFQAWATAAAGRFGYTVRFEPVGPNDPEVGPPTQMAVFGLG